jgi:hypothetical protein
MALGRKTGGRQKGTKNKKNRALAAEIAQRALVSKYCDSTPLDVMLDIMRSTDNPELRLQAAARAAPYVHRQLKSVEQTGEGSNVRVEIGWMMPGNPALPPPDKT